MKLAIGNTQSSGELLTRKPEGLLDSCALKTAESLWQVILQSFLEGLITVIIQVGPKFPCLHMSFESTFAAVIEVFNGVYELCHRRHSLKQGSANLSWHAQLLQLRATDDVTISVSTVTAQ